MPDALIVGSKRAHDAFGLATLDELQRVRMPASCLSQLPGRPQHMPFGSALQQWRHRTERTAEARLTACPCAVKEGSGASYGDGLRRGAPAVHIGGSGHPFNPIVP